MLTVVGHPEVAQEPWFATAASRAAYADLLDDHLATWIGDRTRDDVMSAFTEAGAAAAPVYSAANLVFDPQVRALEMLTRVDDPELGDLLQHNVLYRMSATPGSIRWTGRDHGQDSAEVLIDELGLDHDRFDRLRERGVIR